jgi:hypothetical protein
MRPTRRSWKLLRRFARLACSADEPVEVLHIGDLDRHGESIFDVLAADVQALGAWHVGFTRLAVTEQQARDLGLESSVDDELVVQAEAIPPDVLADLVDDAIRERLDLDLMAEVAERSTAIRAGYEAALRDAGLRAAP